MLSKQEYRNKVLGCWLGKNIGGTLGAPMEWRRQVNNVTFYTQELGGNPLPNDDLDIQLLWLIMLEEKGINPDSALMAEYWQHFVAPYWAEYGNAKVNLQAGIKPPYSGIRNNPYKDSCGAFIRSEIWACIAPGNPHLAAKYAYDDASIDHGDGEGMYAEIFCATMQSAAFVEKDPKTLINIGLSYIPEDCAIAGAVRLAVELYEKKVPWLDARYKMLEAYRGSCFFGYLDMCSQDDIARGLADGKMGYDAPSNIGILVIGLLYGEGDFDKSLCITINCGEDTDCTGATVGALFGIIHGADAIPEKWITPIGRGIKTGCLNSGDLGYFGDQLPQTIDELTDRTERIYEKVTAMNAAPPECLYYDKHSLPQVFAPASRHSFPMFDINVEYLTGANRAPGESAKLRITIKNKYRIQASLSINWYTPDGWQVGPAPALKAYVGQGHWTNDNSVTLDFSLTELDYAAPNPSNRFVMEITVDGRATVMLVPVLLLTECR